MPQSLKPSGSPAAAAGIPPPPGSRARAGSRQTLPFRRAGPSPPPGPRDGRGDAAGRSRAGVDRGVHAMSGSERVPRHCLRDPRHRYLLAPINGAYSHRRRWRTRDGCSPETRAHSLPDLKARRRMLPPKPPWFQAGRFGAVTVVDYFPGRKTAGRPVAVPASAAKNQKTAWPHRRRPGLGRVRFGTAALFARECPIRACSPLTVVQA